MNKVKLTANILFLTANVKNMLTNIKLCAILISKQGTCFQNLMKFFKKMM